MGALLVATAAAYGPAMGGGFVWDDVMLVRDNAALDGAGPAWEAAWGDFFRQGDGQRARSGYTRPVPVLLNALTVGVFGRNPVAFHLGNLALHLLAVWLAFQWLLRITDSFEVAISASAIFALHPMQTEAVAFISGRPDLCAAVATLATLVLYHRSRRTGSVAALLAALLALALGLLSKEVAAAAVVGVVWMEWCCFEERRWSGAGALAAVTAAYVVIRLAGSPPIPRMYFEGGAVPVAAVNLLGFYGGRALWPSDPRILYDHLDVGTVSAWTVVGASLLMWLVGRIYGAARRGSSQGVGPLWFGAFLLPVLHLAPFPTLAAERYLYLPLLGFALVTAQLVHRGVGRTALPRRWGPIVVVVLLAIYGGLTFQRAGDWRSELHLWGVELGRAPVSFKVYQNLGTALAEAGRAQEARAAFRKAWQARPGHPLIFRNLVRIESSVLEPERRGRFLEVALARPPDAAALERWSQRLLRDGHKALAELVRQRSEAPKGGPR